MRYRRNPIEIEAHVWNGFDGVFEIVEELVSPNPVDRQSNDSLAIHSAGGTKVAFIGDVICRDIGDGTVFVLKPEGFKLMYSAVDEDEEVGDE